MMRHRVLCRLTIIAFLCLGSTFARSATELHFCLRTEPKNFNPLLVSNDAEETIRYLTGGVLVRVNRQTQQLEPELAESWKVSKDGRQIAFKLRQGIVFSDGTAFSAAGICSIRATCRSPTPPSRASSATGSISIPSTPRTVARPSTP